MSKNSFLGEAQVYLSEIPTNQKHTDWYTLESQTFGELLCRLNFSEEENILRITVIRARELAPKSGSADPYVKVFLPSLLLFITVILFLISTHAHTYTHTHTSFRFIFSRTPTRKLRGKRKPRRTH